MAFKWGRVLKISDKYLECIWKTFGKYFMDAAPIFAACAMCSPCVFVFAAHHPFNQPVE
jgi:hypothetical protein